MKFSLETPTNENQIHSYNDEYIVVKNEQTSRELFINASLIVTPEKIIQNWTDNNITELNASDIAYLSQLTCEVILFVQQQNSTVPMQLMVELSKRAIGIEMMSLGAASRTYNLLVSEGRKVILALAA